ncbi:cytochrome P450 [Nonomuraea sp. K274]|uniref:Cytochrome P450 n=1 Tax=Nonomuraea cypriaca TaxID=1187855 RepID=A0A931AC27_9ACTN|nr:cytochrome P450 [Nonomuraea cypriaca]MBF8188394.1 cytochrome P450 [Nonomuraea cypriaca]
MARGRLPLAGHLLSLARDPLRFLTSVGSDGSGLVRLDLGTTPMYLVTAYEPADDILAGQAGAFGVGRMFKQLSSLIGDSLATLEGESHLKRRRLLQPPFLSRELPGYGGIMVRRAQSLSDSLREGRSTLMDRSFYRLTLSAAAEALFSVDLAGPVVAEVDRSLPVVTNGVALRAFLPKAFESLPLPLNRRYDLAVRRLRAVIETAIDQHRAAAPAGANLLSALMASRDADSGEGLNDGQIRDEIITIMLAGTDTPAALLSWALYELERHPAAERRLHEELDEVVGDRPAELADVPRLPFTAQVLNEVSRLYSALLIMRRSTSPALVGGVEVPPGTDLLICPYVIHRDPRFFPEPGRFDPDRWSSERAHRLPRKAYLPFGAGPHKCIGDSFAWAELVIVLATVCSRWRLRTATGHAVSAVPGVVPRPNSLPMIPEPRS